MTISFEDFLKLDIRVGTIVEAPGARKPAYPVVDFGPELGRKQLGPAGPNYRPEELVGRQVGRSSTSRRGRSRRCSEVLVLGFPDAAGEVVLVGVERPVPNGGRLY